MIWIAFFFVLFIGVFIGVFIRGLVSMAKSDPPKPKLTIIWKDVCEEEA